MNFKDTMMPKESRIMLSYMNPEIVEAALDTIIEQQAELSFKAGIKEALFQYAWWKDGVQYVGTCGTTLNKALKEWGIK